MRYAAGLMFAVLAVLVLAVAVYLDRKYPKG
jgi:hypothetical protein